MVVALTKEQKEKLKDLLKTIYSREELKEQFERFSAEEKTEASNHRRGTLLGYVGALQEIFNEDAKQRANTKKPDRTMPSLEDLKKKYLGK